MTIPAGVAKGTIVVKVYLGTFRAEATFSATLGEATYTDSSVKKARGRGTLNGIYTLRVPTSATAAGKTLSCSWTQDGGTNINFAAVAVYSESATGVEIESTHRGAVPQSQPQPQSESSVFLQAVTLST